MSSKTDGGTAELKVAAKAAALGMSVALPFGENQKYDLIIGNKHLHRVQVKTTARLARSARGGRFNITASHGNIKMPYTEEHIDFLICCVRWKPSRSKIPRCTYYVIPAEKIRAMGVSLYPHRINRKGFYEAYKEAWDLLK